MSNQESGQHIKAIRWALLGIFVVISGFGNMLVGVAVDVIAPIIDQHSSHVPQEAETPRPAAPIAATPAEPVRIIPMQPVARRTTPSPREVAAEIARKYGAK